jgi:regulator of replication initiation timing
MIPVKGKANIFNLQEKGCSNCEAKIEHIQALKEALSEVVDENEALRVRVVELEAWVNKAGDKIDKRDNQIQDLYTKISVYRDN